MLGMNRRRFVQGLAGTAAAASFPRHLDAMHAAAVRDALTARLAHDPLRPQYHLLPVANWMNDPNGPVYWRGEYHMFYQYNPDGAYWGDMHWGHAVSADMVRWRQLPVALAPTSGGPDSAGVFSGTAAVVDGHVQMMYTGVRSVPEAEATIKNGAQSLLETQCLAISEDQSLRRWRKLTEPVIATPPAGMQVNGFRDPSPWRQGEWWYLTLAMGTRERGGGVLLYRSRDLRQWEFLHILAERKGSIAVPLEKSDANEVWECPEFFALGEGSARRHVLIYSTNGKAYWLSGRLDEAAMRFAPEQSGVLDYGSYYAPKTQVDATGRRILWGWIPETRPLAAYKAAGWAGLMSLPRVLRLGEDGRLRMQVADAAETLRGAEQRAEPVADGPTLRERLAKLRIEGYCGEMRCMAARGSAGWELAVTGEAKRPWLRIAFLPEKPLEVTVNGTRVALHGSSAEPLEMRVWVDGSAMEVVLNGEAACTVRFYPEGTSAELLSPQWTGEAGALHGLSVWAMQSISRDRLTTFA